MEPEEDEGDEDAMHEIKQVYYNFILNNRI